MGPEHSWLARSGRVQYVPVDDSAAMDAFLLLCRTENIIPAIESAHALAGARAWALGKAQEGPFEEGQEPIVVVCVSGRGDKDVDTAAKWFGLGEATLQVIDPSAGEGGIRRDAATTQEPDTTEGDRNDSGGIQRGSHR